MISNLTLAFFCCFLCFVYNTFSWEIYSFHKDEVSLCQGDYGRPQERKGNLSNKSELKRNKGNPLHSQVVMVTY